ncbi:hypothetical protein EVAR_97577_1 [Eumeta japonica]|uniref:Uncharacterized protein n=1 Tax=Eumeta variegata TaxID=151549 RepID=A0A4C1WR11_EUMVA|nr:hypothetical protein EVAR_97577_1 [Eumeta japonica]
MVKTILRSFSERSADAAERDPFGKIYSDPHLLEERRELKKDVEDSVADEGSRPLALVVKERCLRALKSDDPSKGHIHRKVVPPPGKDFRSGPRVHSKANLRTPSERGCRREITLVEFPPPPAARRPREGGLCR